MVGWTAAGVGGGRQGEVVHRSLRCCAAGCCSAGAATHDAAAAVMQWKADCAPTSYPHLSQLPASSLLKCAAHPTRKVLSKG